MSFSDDIWQQAKAHQECYSAGMRAADGESARKLAIAVKALRTIANINNGPFRPSVEWRCREAALYAADALKSIDQ